MKELEVIYNTEMLIDENGNESYVLSEKEGVEAELKKISLDYSLSEENIGTGADWIVILAGLGSLFFLGDKINKNLEAWIKLSKKFISLFKKTKVSFIDSNGAKLLAINKILEDENEIKSIVEVALNEINIQDLSQYFRDNRISTELRSKPLCYYSMIFKVNDYMYYNISIKSNGEISSLDKFGSHHFDFFK